MRSFFCYVRTLDNQFFSCNVACGSGNVYALPTLAYKRFAELGNPLPPEDMIRSMRFVPDPRNLEDGMGYPPDDAGRSDPDSYVVYSEYESGKTMTN